MAQWSSFQLTQPAVVTLLDDILYIGYYHDLKGIFKVNTFLSVTENVVVIFERAENYTSKSSWS